MEKPSLHYVKYNEPGAERLTCIHLWMEPKIVEFREEEIRKMIARAGKVEEGENAELVKRCKISDEQVE